MKRFLTLCAIAAFVAGCGGNDGLSESARNRLAPQVAEIRRAAESFQPDLARQKLAEVRRAVTDLRRRGVINDNQREQVLAAAAEVESHLDLAPTTTTTTTTSPPVVPGPDKEQGKGNGNGKDEGD